MAAILFTIMICGCDDPVPTPQHYVQKAWYIIFRYPTTFSKVFQWRERSDRSWLTDDDSLKLFFIYFSEGSEATEADSQMMTHWKCFYLYLGLHDKMPEAYIRVPFYWCPHARLRKRSSQIVTATACKRSTMHQARSRSSFDCYLSKQCKFR